tara:strand:- start:495 stop:929 length:435 start_codon:yes stop_codon:yes gene_type:complete
MSLIKKIKINHVKECFLLDLNSLGLWSLKQWEKALKNRQITTIAIFKEDRIIGICVYQIITNENELLYFAIHPNFQKKGYGKLLFTKFLELSKESKIKKIFLEVSSKNISANNFYEYFKFKTFKIRKNYYKDGSDAIMKVKYIC